MQDLFGSLRNLTRRAVNAAPPVPFVGGQGGRSIFGSGSEGVMGDRAYDAHGAVGTLFSIVHQIGNKFSSTPWHLYEKELRRNEDRRQEKLDHPFLTVWDKPNDFYTGSFFRRTVQMHVDLVGEGIIVLNKVGNTVIEMWPVRPDRMQPVKHPKRYMTGWVYQGPDGEDVPLTLDQVIQIKYPNPQDPYRGRGPVQTVLADIDAARYSADWNRNFFVNGARPGGIIKVDYRMDDAEFNAFVNRWRQQHQGVSNAHRVAVLENAEWQDTQFSMRDMQFVELRNLPRELIREAFAYPKPMLGTVDDVNRANAEAGKEIMAELQTIPRLRDWRDVVNTFLLPQFANGTSYVLDFDDPTPINHEAKDRERNSKAVSARNLVLSGYDPADVARAMDLPEMNWVGIPAAASNTPEEDMDTEGKNIPSGGRMNA